MKRSSLYPCVFADMLLDSKLQITPFVLPRWYLLFLCPVHGNITQGGAKIQEAFYIFQELCEKYVWTVPLMNGSAVCQMHMGRFDEAETILLEALSKVCTLI
jgi:hypothetical protein